MSDLIKNLKIQGMTCQACATRLEKVLNKKDSIKLAEINFATETAVITLNEMVADEELLTWIKKTGFTGQLIQDDHQESVVDDKPPYRLMGLFVLSVPFWVGMFGMLLGSHALMPPVWVQFVLSSIVQFGFGWVFYQGAYVSLKGRLANMDVLVALGTSAIWLYSTYVWILGGHEVYFEASVMVIVFVSLGKYLEKRTKKQGLDGLSAMMSLIPKDALVNIQGSWVKTNIASIRPNDVLLARQGDKIAVDGVVCDGVGCTNEAHLTGESRFLDKTVGDTVMAGSIVTQGSFSYQAVAVGRDTALSDMIQALNDAQGSKAHIARMADKVAGVFVPLVVVIAVLAFLVNYWSGLPFDVALMRAVAVLVVACPCALGLATPAAIIAGMSLAARHGIIFKDAISLERAGKIDVMVFDKTGTLTLGMPKVQAVRVFSDKNKQEALQIAASLEQYATHPLAKALVEYAKEYSLALWGATEVVTHVGEGIVGVIDGIGFVKVGTPQFVGINAPAGEIWQIASIVALSVNDVPVGVFAFSDELRADSADVLSKLNQEGIDTVIMSGDHQKVVDFVASHLTVTAAYGNLSPRDKANKIKEMQASGKKVAMVGDGVNDAPAIAQANTGLAVGSASDIAKHTASAYLLGEALTHAYYAQKIAKLTLTTIKQNLFFAFFYNCIGISLAVFGLLNPMIAALAMALSSISVLFNAIRLKRVSVA